MRLSPRLLILPLIAGLIVTAGCDSGGANSPGSEPSSEPGDEPDSAPVVSAIEPDSAQHGTPVTITGEHFSETASENTVTFNGTEADVTSTSEAELVAEVPKGAGSGPVAVEVDGEQATGTDFTYIFTYTMSTYAGDGTAGHADGSVENAQFDTPIQTARGPNGNLFVADYNNHAIRKITPDGTVSTFAGTAGESGHVDATGQDARFNNPAGIAVDAEGHVFVVDYENNVIRKITPDRTVTTFAGAADGTSGARDGAGTDARFDSPWGLAIGEDGTLYVADAGNHKIRTIRPDGVVITLAGDGTEGDQDDPEAQFAFPGGLAVDADGTVYVGDRGNHRIRTISSAGEVSTLAGSMSGHSDGIGAEARFNSPTDLAFGPEGNLYVADHFNHVIRKVTPEGAVTTVDGAGTDVQFNHPSGVAFGADGHLYVTDRGNHALRKVTLE